MLFLITNISALILNKMKLILLFVFIIFVNSIQVTKSEWSLKFSDEFDGEKLDSRFWTTLNELSNENSFFFKYSIVSLNLELFHLNQTYFLENCNIFYFFSSFYIPVEASLSFYQSNYCF
jgi:hypothetical protein